MRAVLCLRCCKKPSADLLTSGHFLAIYPTVSVTCHRGGGEGPGRPPRRLLPVSPGGRPGRPLVFPAPFPVPSARCCWPPAPGPVIGEPGAERSLDNAPISRTCHQCRGSTLGSPPRPRTSHLPSLRLRTPSAHQRPPGVEAAAKRPERMLPPPACLRRVLAAASFLSLPPTPTRDRK